MADTINVQVRLDAKSANAALRNFNNQIVGANVQLGKTQKSLGRSINLLRIYAGAWIGANAAMSALREIGTVQNMERAIGTVTSGSRELNETWERLREVSLRTRSDFESNIVLFQRLTFSTERLGATAEQVENVLVAVAAGLRLGGATGQEAASTIRQLSQAFSKGKLDGDEFRSVMENAGFMMVRFADSIGVTIGELIEMSRQGKLTADVMLDGFADVSKEMEERLAKAPRTVDDAINDLRTTWLDFIRTLELSGTAVAILDGITWAFNQWKTSIELVREEFVRLGIAEARTSGEVAARRIQLFKEAAEAQEKLQKLQQGQQVSEGGMITGFVTPQEQTKELQDQLLSVFEIGNELDHLSGKIKELKKVEDEQSLIAKQNEEARLAAAEAYEKERKRLEEMRKAKEKLRREEDFEREARSMMLQDMAREEAERQKAKDAVKAQADEQERLYKIIQVGSEVQIAEPAQLNQLQEFAKNVMTLEDAFVNAFQNMEDALVEFVMTGKLDFKSMVDSMIADIARIAIQQNITKPLAASLGGLFGPSTGTTGTGDSGGGIFSKFFNFMGSFNKGGSFEVGGRSGVDKNLVAFNATKGERVTITPEGQQAGGVTVVMNIQTQDAESFMRNRNQIVNAFQSDMAVANRNL